MIKMKKIILCVISFCLLQCCIINANAGTVSNTSLDLNETVIKLLMPQIQNSVNVFYFPYLTISPTVAPYYGIKIIETKDEELKIEVLPYVGAHIAVGKDEITFMISNSGQVTVTDFKHIESYELPSHLQSLIKKPLP